MKHRVLLLLGALALAVVPLATTSCAVGEMINCMGKPTLKVFNWGEYIDKSTVRAFEKENKVCVKQVQFDSVETAITKMNMTTYDVVFLSEYGVEELFTKNEIVKLDWSRLGFDIETDLNEGLKSLLIQNNLYQGSDDFQLLDYMAPYMWGELGMVYNSDKISDEYMAENGWEALRDPNFRVAYYDSARDGFVPPLSVLGYSINTESQAEIDAAADWLVTQRNRLGMEKLSYVTDEVLDDMAGLKYDIALVYSGDANYLMTEEPTLHYYRPSNMKSTVFSDGMVIPTKSTKQDMAYKFLAHMLSYESALANSETIGYTSARQDVTEALAADVFADVANSYNFVVNPLDEVMRYRPGNKNKIDYKWNEIRAMS